MRGVVDQSKGAIHNQVLYNAIGSKFRVNLDSQEREREGKKARTRAPLAS